jgi:hypothetical protein
MTSPKPTALASAQQTSWAVALALFSWLVSFHPMRSADLWWHLAAGRWIVTHRAIPYTDPFSYTGGRWLNHEWFADVIYHRWSAMGGVSGLVYWYWAVIALTGLLLFWLCRRLGAAAWASALAAGFSLATAAVVFEIRPHLYSLVLYLVLLLATLTAPRFPVWLPALFLVWVNLHAGFIFGLLVLALVLLLRTADGTRARGGAAVWAVLRSQWRDFLVVLTCGLATLANPFGYHVFEFPLRYALERHSPFRELKEWLPAFSPEGVRSPLLLWLMLLFVIAAAMIIRRAPKRSLTTAPVFLGVLTLLMNLHSGRFISLFAASAALTTSQALTRPRPLRQTPAPRKTSALSAVGLLPPLVAIAIVVTCLSRYPLGSPAFPHLVSLESFPIDTLDFVVKNQLLGKVFSYLGWGGYVSYRTHGGMRVYIDSRGDTVYPDRIFNDYRAVQYELGGWVDVVESSGADYFLWLNLETPQVQLISQPDILLATGRWTLLHKDVVSTLLVRTGKRLPASLAEATSVYHDLALAGEAMRRGDKLAAEVLLRNALRRDPTSSFACWNLARTLAWQDRWHDSAAMQEQCDGIFPEPDSAADLGRFVRKRRAGVRN